MARTFSWPGFSRGEKWLFFGCLVLFSGIAGLALWGNARDALPAIAFPVRRPAPKPNGYDFYIQAAQLFGPISLTGSVDPVDDIAPPITALARAQKYSLKRRQAWLSANASSFALFRRGLKTPSAYPEGWHSLQNSPVWFQLRQLARNQVKRINTLKMEGRWGEAAGVGIDTMQMGGDSARGGPAIPRLVGTSVIAITREALERFDNLPGHLSAREARAATARLENLINGLPSYSQAVDQERWSALNAFVQASTRSNWRAMGDKNLEGTPATWQQKLTAQHIFKGEVVRRINATMDATISDLKQPYNAPSVLPNAESDLITEKFVIYTSRLRWVQAREQTQLNLLLLRFALRAYQADHGAFPASLHSLSPSYLKRIPTDTFASNKPLHYALKGKTYRLWSIGPDGVNDNGKPVPRHRPLISGEIPGPIPISPNAKGDWVAGLNR